MRTLVNKIQELQSTASFQDHLQSMKDLKKNWDSWVKLAVKTQELLDTTEPTEPVETSKKSKKASSKKTTEPTEKASSKTTEPKKEKEPSGFAKPKKLSDDSAEVFKVPKGTEMSDIDVKAAILKYAEEHLNSTDKKSIRLDSALKNILKTSEDELPLQARGESKGMTSISNSIKHVYA